MIKALPPLVAETMVKALVVHSRIGLEELTGELTDRRHTGGWLPLFLLSPVGSVKKRLA